MMEREEDPHGPTESTGYSDEMLDQLLTGASASTASDQGGLLDRDTDSWPGPTTEIAARLQALERENGELRYARSGAGM